MNNEQTKAHREKYWSECDDQEKIRRLRQEVKLLQADVSKLMRFMHFLSIPIFMKDELPMNWTETPNKRTGDEVYF
jgi:hypothetical protein